MRAVFFDAVGTVLHPEPSPFVVYAAAAARQGVTIPQEVIRERFLEAFHREEAADGAVGWVTSEAREYERWRTIVCSALAETPDPEACFQHLWEHYAQPDSWRLNPDAEGVFATLADRGVILGMVSNFDRRLVGIVENCPALAPLRDRLLISSQLGYRKPSAAVFEEVIRLTGVPAEEILIVGDDVVNDYEGPRRAGLQAMLLDERDRHGRIARRIRSLGELPGLLTHPPR